NMGSLNSVSGNVTGGFVGYNSDSGVIRSAYSVHRVSGNASNGTGAFAGNNFGTISYAYAAGRTERNGVELSGERALFAGNVEGGSVNECKVQKDISDVSEVNGNSLKQNGMSQADGYSTLVIDELVYLDAREARINRNGICEVRAIVAVAGKQAVADYTDQSFNLEGYEVICEISGGISSFGVAGTTLLKYQIVKGSEIVSSSTIVVTVI
ncbi:MAG: hypothetical protein K2I79_01385, partial [Clostridia bacterium]|nr:hypothetical protein [Clostridia bacterium]